MAICPDHGGYTGDSCKKCVDALKETMDAVGGRAVERGMTQEKMDNMLKSVPELDRDDQLALLKLENASIKSFHAMQNAQAQFQNFARMMFEKYGVKPAEYTLDMEKLEFVPRSL